MQLGPHRRLILAAVLVALIVRVVCAWTYWTGKPLTHDEREYLSLAASLAEGRGFTYPDTHDAGTGQRFGRAPGYPAFLSLFRPDADSQGAPRVIQLAQALLLSLGVLMIAAIAREAAGDRAALIAAWLAALYPPLIWIPAYVLSESLYLPLALGCTMLLARPQRRHIVAAGVVAGIAILVRPAMLLFMPLAALWLLRRRRLDLAMLLTVVTALTVMPWTIRNINTYERFVLVATEGGVTFWTGNHPLARGEGDLAANPELKRAELAFRSAHPALDAEALEPLYYQEALQWIKQNPGEWLLLTLRKAFYTIVPIGPSYALHSVKYRAVSIVPYLVVLPFALAGARRLWRSPRRPVALGWLALSSILVCLIFFPQERFRLPVIDPVLIISAAALAGRPQS